MKETVVRILMQWEPNSDKPNDGENHLYRLITHSETEVTIPHENYMCGIKWSTFPGVDAPPEALDKPEIFCKICYDLYKKEFK